MRLSTARFVTSPLALSLLALTTIASAQTAPPAQRPAAVPSHAWTFDEGVAPTAHDYVGGVDGTGGADALWITGEAAALGAAHDRLVVLLPQTLDDPNAYVDFGAAVAAFGTADFTVTHDIVVLQSVPGTLVDVLGNRTSYGHGNFFAVRMRGDGILSAELDQDAGGTNYVGVVGEGKPVNDMKLHHLAYVRAGGTLSLYVDGALAGAAHTASYLPTDVRGESSFRIGRRAPFAFTSLAAFYDDLRIYPRALTADEVQAIANGG